MGMRKSEGAEHKAEGSNGKQQGLGLYKEDCGADKQQGRQEEKDTLSTPEGLCGGLFQVTESKLEERMDRRFSCSISRHKRSFVYKLFYFGSLIGRDFFPLFNGCRLLMKLLWKVFWCFYCASCKEKVALGLLDICLTLCSIPSFTPSYLTHIWALIKKR